MDTVDIRRLRPGDQVAARDAFEMMAAVFDEGGEPLGADHIAELLGRETFWAFGAFVDTEAVGCLTAHTLPMTRTPSSELFIYDLAVRPDHQRQGVASRLVRALREAAADAGIHDVFVPADNEDLHALEFYRALGAEATAVTFFTFGAP